MKNLTIIGVALMIGAFVILGLFIVLPSVLPIDNAPFLKNTLQTTLCNSGDTLTSKRSEYDTPTSKTISTDFSCVTPDNQSSYDVSSKGIVIGIVGYLVPFLLGLFMFTFGTSQHFVVKVNGVRTSYLPKQNSENDHASLAQRLTELKTARDAGLIKQTEYDAKRKEILKEA